MTIKSLLVSLQGATVKSRMQFVLLIRGRFSGCFKLQIKLINRLVQLFSDVSLQFW